MLASETTKLLETVSEGAAPRRCASPQDVLAYARDLGLKIVDFKFTDMPGTWQHFSIPVTELDESLFAEGIGFDGSSIRGFQAINESDMLLMPDPATAILDPASAAEIILKLIAAGVRVEVHHHEVATAGQCEIDMHFNSLVTMADSLMMYKYVVKNVSKAHGKTATFMPKPLFADNGSGMHVHQSLWKKGTNTFFDKDGYGLLSESARFYIGGLLAHSAALLALCAPTTNSYRRLVPGFEAPVNLVYSCRNRSAGVRIPMYSSNPSTKRIEYRCPDATCNPYLAFSAMLMAGLDGIQKRIDPGQPADFNLYEADPATARKIKTVPGSLTETLDALEADHDFLLAGGVFTKDLIATWIDYKRRNEVDPVRLRPHPYEFFLYYDV
jgi:glutamine synthetase